MTPEELFALENFDVLLDNRELFNEVVYTSLTYANEEIEQRWNDPELQHRIDPASLPELLTQKPAYVLHRQVVTPNYEVLRFVSIADAMGKVPVFFEYYDDKFVTENEWKYHLGHMCFYYGHGKKGGLKILSENIIDFNRANGKPLSSIRTAWDQNLVDFHHELLSSRFANLEYKLFNGSPWYASNGGKAVDYYKNFLRLFVRNGILFENFMLTGDEHLFTKEIILPAFMEIWRTTGKKPLIVALEPTEIEGDSFWMCHPPETRAVVLTKLESI